MITEDAYRKLKREVEEARTEADRARGAFDQLTRRLKEEFGCENLKEAKALLEKLTKKREEAEKDLDKAMAEYERKWKPRND